MTFSIVIPWRDGAGRGRIQEWVKRFWEETFPDAELLFVDSGDEPFSRSKSRNFGLSQASCEFTVLADADTVVPKQQILDGLEICRNNGWAVCYEGGKYYNLTEAATELLLISDPTAPLVEPTEFDHKLISWAGMLAVPTATALSVGYDERFVGWGHEDLAFLLEMGFSFAAHQRVNGFACHLWHPRNEAEFGSELELKNRKLFQVEYVEKYEWKDPRNKW